MLPWWWLKLGFSQQGCTPNVLWGHFSQGSSQAARLLQQALWAISSPTAFAVDFYISLFPLISGRIFDSPVRPYVLEQAWWDLAPMFFFWVPVLPGVLHVTNRFLYTHNWRWIGQQAFEMISKHSWSFSNKHILVCVLHINVLLCWGWSSENTCLAHTSEAQVSSCHDAAEYWIWNTAYEELGKSSEDAVLVSSIWSVLPQQWLKLRSLWLLPWSFACGSSLIFALEASYICNL